jgi:hypothetical protein
MSRTVGRWGAKYLPSRVMLYWFCSGALIAVVCNLLLEPPTRLDQFFGMIAPYAKFALRFFAEMGYIVGAVSFLTYMAEKFHQVPLVDRIITELSKEFREIAFESMEFANRYGLVGVYNSNGALRILDDVNNDDEVYCLITYIHSWANQ